MILLLLYAEKMEEDTKAVIFIYKKASIFISNKFIFFDSLTTFFLFFVVTVYFKERDVDQGIHKNILLNQG